MGGWRNKLIFLLIVYFAGFATAVYYAVPAYTEAAEQMENSQNFSSFAQQGVSTSFEVRAQQLWDIAKDKSRRLSLFIREKIEEKQVAKDLAD